MQAKHDPCMILIVGETIDGQLSPGTKRLGRQAWQLAGLLGGRPHGVLTGDGIDTVAGKWSQMAGIDVTALDDHRLRFPNPAAGASALASIVAELHPSAVCFSHTMRACQAAATLARQLKTACVTAVEAISVDGHRTLLRRSIHGGKLLETVSPATRPFIVTLMPGAAAGSPPKAASGSEPTVTTRSVATTDDRCQPQSIHRQRLAASAVSKARVIVSGGRGLGGPEQIDMLKKVADLFKEAAVGGSRGACDLGWLPHSLQIGETGRTVAPSLYLACGISGAPQHLAGIQDAQTIVAVNSDPQAAIFSIAHYAVIEDLRSFLPLLLKRYAQTIAKGEIE